MEKFFSRAAEYSFYLFLFLLPWQTRWVWFEDFLNGQHWEYGSFSLYAVEIILFLSFAFCCFAGCRRKKVEKNYFSAVIYSLLIISAVSVFQSQDKEISTYATFRLLEGALVIPWLVLSVDFSWLKAGLIIVASGVIQAWLGIFQFATQKVAANKWLGLAGHDPSILGDQVIETDQGRWLRAYGAFPHPNMLAGFLVFCLLVLVGIWIYKYKELKCSWLFSILLPGVQVILLIGLLFTFCRSAWLAYAVSLAVFLAVGLWKKEPNYLKITAVILASAILSSAVFFWQLPEVSWTRIAGGRLEAQSSGLRSSYYHQAESLISELWYQGTGIGSYTSGLYNRDTTHPAWNYQPVHNIYVLAAAELGIFGGAIFLILVFLFIYRFFIGQVRKLVLSGWLISFGLAFLSLLIIGFFDHYLWSLFFGIMLFWLIFGFWRKADLETEKSKPNF